jgi:hypothetical protein
MRQKREIAQRLLACGLSITQVSQQLRCSRYFVQQAREWPACSEELEPTLSTEAR